MIAVDTNVLVHAHRAEMPLHQKASDAVASLAEGISPWAIPWPCVHEFLAVVTHPRIFDPPTPVEVAVDQVTAWAESPTLVFLTEAGDHLTRLADLLRSSGVTGPRVHDARIAVLCLSHGVNPLWILDRDYGRFPAVRTANPLVSTG